MTFNTLISAAELRALLASDAAPTLIDTGFDLADVAAGERAWREGHLPGSLYLHLDRDLSGPKTGRNGRHPLPAREAFAATLGRCGITPQTQVVVFDRQGGTLHTKVPAMHFWRSLAGVTALSLWFYSIGKIGRAHV